MEEKELKHVIALLLEDAKRLQELEPNAGTEARIGIAKSFLNGKLVCHPSEETNVSEPTINLPYDVVLALMTEDDLVKLRLIRMSVTKLLAAKQELAL